MKRLLFAVVVVQFVGLVRPLLGMAHYFTIRGTLVGQRQAVIAALLDPS